MLTPRKTNPHAKIVLCIPNSTHTVLFWCAGFFFVLRGVNMRDIFLLCLAAINVCVLLHSVGWCIDLFSKCETFILKSVKQRDIYAFCFGVIVYCVCLRFSCCLLCFVTSTLCMFIVVNAPLSWLVGCLFFEQRNSIHSLCIYLYISMYRISCIYINVYVNMCRHE